MNTIAADPARMARLFHALADETRAEADRTSPNQVFPLWAQVNNMPQIYRSPFLLAQLDPAVERNDGGTEFQPRLGEQDDPPPVHGVADPPIAVVYWAPSMRKP